MDDVSRRRLLTVGGSGTALTLAGCLSFGDESDANGDTADGDPVTTTANGNPSSNNGTDAPDAQGDGEYTVTVAANIDQESAREIQQELQSKQQEIQQQVENDEISQEEAQTQMQEAQQAAQEARLELVREAVGTLEEHLSGTEGIAAAETVADSGLLLVSGGPAQVLDLLGLEETAGLLAESEFEALQQTGP